VAKVAEQLKKDRTLSTLPGFKLEKSILVSNDIKEALNGKEIVLGVTPSHTVRSTFESAKPHLKKGMLVINASKGLEPKTHVGMSEVIRQTVPQISDIVILSGPSHAEEGLRQQAT